jgi:hypothetical protein
LGIRSILAGRSHSFSLSQLLTTHDEVGQYHIGVTLDYQQAGSRADDSTENPVERQVWHQAGVVAR